MLIDDINKTMKFLSRDNITFFVLKYFKSNFKSNCKLNFDPTPQVGTLFTFTLTLCLDFSFSKKITLSKNTIEKIISFFLKSMQNFMTQNYSNIKKKCKGNESLKTNLNAKLQ